MTKHYDALETRSADERRAAQETAFLAQVSRAMESDGSCLVADGPIKSLDDITRLPVLRKSQLVA